MKQRLFGAAILMTLLTLLGACATLDRDLVLSGVVAEVSGDRVHIASAKPARASAGEKVSIVQRVEQKAGNPTAPPWHLLKPVASGRISEVTPEGAWVTIESGRVEPSGEIQLRREDYDPGIGTGPGP